MYYLEFLSVRGAAERGSVGKDRHSKPEIMVRDAGIDVKLGRPLSCAYCAQKKPPQDDALHDATPRKMKG